MFHLRILYCQLRTGPLPFLLSVFVIKIQNTALWQHSICGEYAFSELTKPLHLHMYRVNSRTTSFPSHIVPTKYIVCSTSIQNIILRKSLRENLNVVVPKRGQNQLLDPHGMFIPFNLSWLNSQTPWHKTFMRENAYNVMALHCKWNHQSISAMLRKPTKFVTMIRDPADTFESHYLFYDQQKYTKMNLTMFLKRYE